MSLWFISEFLAFRRWGVAASVKNGTALGKYCGQCFACCPGKCCQCYARCMSVLCNACVSDDGDRECCVYTWTCGFDLIEWHKCVPCCESWCKERCNTSNCTLLLFSHDIAYLKRPSCTAISFSDHSTMYQATLYPDCISNQRNNKGNIHGISDHETIDNVLY